MFVFIINLKSFRMKTLLHYLFMMCCIYASYGNTYTGSVTLTSQQEVNDFGANGYTVITGYLEILPSVMTTTDITDLSPLSTITSIGGTPTNNDGTYLEISDNNNLITLNGLENLTTISGGLYIKNNAILNSLTSIASLTSHLGGGLHIENNPSLINLNGLNISSVAHVQIKNNSQLQTLSNFGSFGLSGNVFIENNQVLGSIPNFNIPGNSLNRVSIINNDAITSLPIINKRIAQTLIIDDNDGLTNLIGLENAPLGAVIPIGQIFILNNDNLTSLNGLNTSLGLVAVIHIENNPQLINIDWLSNYTKNALAIIDNDALISLSPLSNYTEGTLLIDGNSSLSNMNGLENFIDAFQLTIRNTNISSLSALSNLSLIENTLHVENNQSLTSLNGLSAITSIGNNALVTNFKIINNDALTTLDGLDSLMEIKADITISNNDTLEDFCALSTAINNGLTETYLVSNNAFNPTVNDFNTNNCSTLGVDEFKIFNIKLHPNPVIEYLQIQDANHLIQSITIYTADGREIKTAIQNNIVSFKNFNAGLYLVNVRTVNNNEKTFKIIKH